MSEAAAGWVWKDLTEGTWEKGIGPGIVDQKIVGPKDSNAMLMSVARMEGGVKSPPHRHRYLQVFYFLEGEGTVLVDEKEVPVQAGSVVRFLNGETHSVVNPGPDPLTLLEVRVLPRDQDEWE